jgi:hypothetical protein
MYIYIYVCVCMCVWWGHARWGVRARSVVVIRHVSPTDSQGLDLRKWRFSAKNAEYKLCDTYPALIVVPAEITDDELDLVAAFRSRKRLPGQCRSWIGVGYDMCF